MRHSKNGFQNTGFQRSVVSRRGLLTGSASIAALGLAGCGLSGDTSNSPTSNPGGPSGTLRIVQGGAIESLDPHYVNNVMLVMPAGLLEGLVFSDAKGTGVVPAAAESWQVSEDQKTYTFKMRKGATWSNGDPVVAGDAERTFKRLLTPTGAGSNYAGGSSSYQLGVGIKGATDFLSGAQSDWATVGITAPDDETVVIELDNPNPDFLLLMSHYSMVLLPKTVEPQSQAWQQPKNWVGNGAYVPAKWEPTSLLEMTANPKYWDSANVKVGTIRMQMGGDPPSTVLAFKNGDLDILRVSGAIMRNDPALQKESVKVDGYTVTYLQRMWGGHPALTNKTVRRALSMGIDREALAEVNGDVAGVSLVPGVVPGWTPELGISYDPDGARKLVTEAGLDKLPNARVQSAAESPFLEVLREQWKEVFGLTLAIDILEAGVHADTRWAPYEDTNVMSFYHGSFSGLSTMNNWLYNIFGYNYTRQFSLSLPDWQAYRAVQADKKLDGPAKAAAVEQILATKSTPEAQEFAKLVNQARASLDDGERLRNFLAAAKVREEMAFSIPVLWGAAQWAVKPKVKGLQPRPSPEGYYYKYLAIEGS